MTEQVKDDTGCYDIRGRDTAQRFAKYPTKTLNLDLHSVLQYARSLLPDNHIGDKLWLTNVSGCTVYESIIADWARDFADAICTMKPLRNTRRYPLVTAYKREWGDWAALDACAIVIGSRDRVSVLARCEQLGCKWDSYKKVRNFVASALLTQMAEFEWSMAISIAKHKAEG